MKMQAIHRSEAVAVAAELPAFEQARYGAATPRWPAFVGIVAAHAAALYALVAFDVVSLHRPPPRLAVFDVAPDVPPPAEPPPPAPPPPAAAPMASAVDAPVVPPPIVMAAAPPPAQAQTVATPPAPKVEAAATGVAGGTGESVILPDFSGGQLGNAAPRYPTESRRRREQGTVVLRVMVQPDGRSGACEVHRTSGHDRLDKAAREAVCRWTFQPATRGGVAVSWPMDVPIPFVLRS